MPTTMARPFVRENKMELWLCDPPFSFTCFHCGKDFKMRCEIRKHIRTIHPEPRQPGCPWSRDVTGHEIFCATPDKNSSDLLYDR